MIKLLVVAAGGWFGYRWWKDRQTGVGGAQAGKYEFVSGYVGGAKEGDDVPVVVLLHGQASTPQEAIDLVPISRPARVLVPRGLVPEANGRFSFFDRNLAAGAARDAAIHEASTALGDAIASIVEAKDYGVTKPATPMRAVLVGLDSTAPLAVAVGVRHPLQVRQTWAIGGGAVPGTWLPEKLPLLNNLSSPLVRKISPMPALAVDEGTAKAANQRGFNWEVRPALGPAESDKIWKSEWFPQLEELLTAP